MIQGTEALQSPRISADGRYVMYDSGTNNLVPGDTNGTYDVFVFDRLTARTSRVSLADDGTQAASDANGEDISADGRFITFSSYASGFVPGDTNDVTDIFLSQRF